MKGLELPSSNRHTVAKALIDVIRLVAEPFLEYVNRSGYFDLSK